MKPQKKSLKLAEVSSWGLRKEAFSITEKQQEEAAGAEAEAAARSPGDPAQILHDGGHAKPQVFSVDKNSRLSEDNII